MPTGLPSSTASTRVWTSIHINAAIAVVGTSPIAGSDQCFKPFTGLYRPAGIVFAMSKGSETRRRIIDAAEEVVLRDGVGRLTLDAAAAQACLSKGGVLYHFPTRDALVAGMVDRIVEEFDHDLASRLAGDTSPGSFTLAYIRSTMEPGGEERVREDRLGAALIAAVAGQPALIRPLQEAFDRWQTRIEDDGIDPAHATVLRLAADGLWLSQLFGLAAPVAKLRAQVGKELELMVERR